MLLPEGSAWSGNTNSLVAWSETRAKPSRGLRRRRTRAGDVAGGQDFHHASKGYNLRRCDNEYEARSRGGHLRRDRCGYPFYRSEVDMTNPALTRSSKVRVR